MRVGWVSVAVALALTLPACDGGRRDNRAPSGRPLVTYTLSGSVSEITPAGSVPLEGVRIEETHTHQYATSDEGGLYSLSGLSAANSTFSASKAGYVTDKRMMSISGDTRLEIRLRKR